MIRRWRYRGRHRTNSRPVPQTPAVPHMKSKYALAA